jgi:hypothetical protein
MTATRQIEEGGERQLTGCLFHHGQQRTGTQRMNALSEKPKRSASLGTPEAYDPELLLNSLMDRLHLSDDGALAQRLRMDKRLLGKIRERRLQISGSMLMQMQEATGIEIVDLRRILGDRRNMGRMACKAEQRK